MSKFFNGKATLEHGLVSFIVVEDLTCVHPVSYDEAS